jgi:hypothetical protein
VAAEGTGVARRRLIPGESGRSTDPSVRIGETLHGRPLLCQGLFAPEPAGHGPCALPASRLRSDRYPPRLHPEASLLPILYPVVAGLKYDPTWFGALVAVNLQTAFLSPPVAMSAYYLRSVVPQWDLGTIYRGMADFMVIQVICLVLVMLFPQIALWFPNWLFGP